MVRVFPGWEGPPDSWHQIQEAKKNKEPVLPLAFSVWLQHQRSSPGLTAPPSEAPASGRTRSHRSAGVWVQKSPSQGAQLALPALLAIQDANAVRTLYYNK